MADKILVIEDEPGIVDNISYALTTEGFECQAASTGKEGLDNLGESSFDLIVLDIGLPDISGIEVCKEIRKKSQIPILFLTARSEEIDKVLGLEMGADDYMVKPFSPRELVARIRAILRRTTATMTEQESTSDPKFPFAKDSNRREIRYFNQKLDLSAYEYNILSVLLGHPGWVYSRDRIMSIVWEEPGMVTERTVDAHIKSLRQKLRAINPDIEAIITHRSVGYSLRESW